MKLAVCVTYHYIVHVSVFITSGILKAIELQLYNHEISDGWSYVYDTPTYFLIGKGSASGRLYVVTRLIFFWTRFQLSLA